MAKSQEKFAKKFSRTPKKSGFSIDCSVKCRILLFEIISQNPNFRKPIFFEETVMRCAVGIVLLFVIFCTSSISAQQGYKGWTLPQALEEEQSKKAAEVSEALKKGSIDKATFETYFGKYYFNRWTKPERISQLSGYVRTDFLRNDLGNADGEARRMLLDITVKAMKQMKSDPKVYPVAQVNAVIVLSNLYEDIGKTVPFSPAVSVLIEELKNEKAPLANQERALDGLVRYAYLGVADPKLRDKDLPALFISIATGDKVPKNRDVEIHTLFFRAKAVEGLGALCRSAKPAPGESADGLTAIVETLLTIIEDKSEKSNEVRNHAMLAFAELNLIAASAGGVKLDSARIVDAITAFARATCDRQQQFIDEVRRSEQANTSGGMRGGMGGGMGGMSSGMGMSGGMGSDMGGTGGMGSGMGMGASGGSEKMIRRIEECIASSRFAFHTVKGAIQGLSGGRNETSIIALLNKEDAVTNAGTVKMLAEIQKSIDEYTKFLTTGPQGSNSRQAQRPSSGGSMMGGGTPRPGGSPAAAARNAKTPKVTMDDIYNELAALATKFDELRKRG